MALKKKTWDSDKVGAIEQNGILDESLRREVGGRGMEEEPKRRGLGLLKRRGFSLPLLSSIGSNWFAHKQLDTRPCYRA